VWAARARAAARRLRVGRRSFEAQLVFEDGSLLHFRHDPHTRWVQAWADGAGGLAPELEPRIAGFELKGRRLELRFDDGSRLEARLGAFGTRFRAHE